MRDVKTRDITGKMIVLGTGTSVGVPTIGCGCAVCTSTNPKNNRTRCSVILGLPEGNLLIDTAPDMREQLLREGIGVVHSVLYTHEHADHVFGLDDLRLMQFYLGGALPLYCTQVVEERIRKAFDYAFHSEPDTHAGATPKLQFHRIASVNEGGQPFQVLGATITPILQQHGPRFQTLGFRIGRVAYCTDLNHMPEESKAHLQGLDTLILDALRHAPHSTHLSLDEALALVEELRPRRTYFTHICHDLEHEATNASLPAGVELGFDGLVVELK